ncbi:MAG: nicotinate (nicotinamide) nucleotide adenylyltransferase [Terracidiphilus sp.]
MDQHPPAGQRVAFFGGSFDPPHQGHLAVARAARTALALDTVLFAPVGAQPLKPHGSTASFEDRVEMTRLAVEGTPDFEVSLIDAPKPFAAPNYTLETLLHLRAELGPGGALFCLMGADSFLGLRRWHRSTEIPFVAPLIVASRPGQPLDDLRAALPHGLKMEDAPAPPTQAIAADAFRVHPFLLRNAVGDSAPFYLLAGLHVEISASQIRDLIRGGIRAGIGQESQGDSEFRLSRQQLLPVPVLDYILSHKLYR